MIRSLVDFALNNRIRVLSLAFLLFIWGLVSFHNLPIEAYPDVADTYVQIISQWPGHVAEEVDQQITVLLEVQLNGVPHLTTLVVSGRTVGHHHDLRRRHQHIHGEAGGIGSFGASHHADGSESGTGARLQPDRRILRKFGEEKARRNAPFGGRFVRYAAAASGCMCPSCVRSVY